MFSIASSFATISIFGLSSIAIDWLDLDDLRFDNIELLDHLHPHQPASGSVDSEMASENWKPSRVIERMGKRMSP